jgi:hypothetical protein
MVRLRVWHEWAAPAARLWWRHRPATRRAGREPSRIVLECVAAMKSMHPIAIPGTVRLVCRRCGLTADPGGAGRHVLTAVSHSGRSVASERAGHEVALDLCRSCMRETLRSALGASPPHAGAPTAPASPRPFETACSLAEAEAFINRCNARLDALHRGEWPEPDG